MYQKEDLIERIKSGIMSERWYFISDIFDGLGISPTTFYKYFPVDSGDYETIQMLLRLNKMRTKSGLRRKLENSESATGIIALYKLIGTDEERRLLSSTSLSQNQQQTEIRTEARVELSQYKQKVVATLKSVNRYSVAIEPAIAALASAMATLDSVNCEIASLSSPFIREVTTQGEKLVPHPAFAMQQKAMESIAKQSKLLGLDYENAPATAADSPLTTLTATIAETLKNTPETLPADGRKRTRKTDHGEE